MRWRYTLADVEIDEGAIAAVREALASNWLTMGPRTKELERRWAERFEAEHAIALSSGSAGLHLACRAVGVGAGDEVIVPAMSFVADGNAPHWCGAETVLADIAAIEAPLTGAAEVAERLSERTRAVIVVHMFGYAAEVGEIAALCAERGVALIEDCCESPGARLADGSEVGGFGDVAVWSLFSKSQIPVGEGGLVTTDDDRLAEKMRLSRSHAMTSVTWDRHRGHAETYDVVDLGFNYRIDEPRAALATAQLDQLGERIERLRAGETAYRECVAKTAGVEPLFDAGTAARSAHYSMPVLLADGRVRDAARNRLIERGIQTSYYPSLSQLAVFVEGSARNPCPRAEEFAARHLTLPLSPSISGEQADEICAELGAAIGGD